MPEGDLINSDGTSGEPSAPAPYVRDQGTVTGLPDYKYLERLAQRKEKLRRLRQRRNPDGVEESDDELIKEIGTPPVELIQPVSGVELYYVHTLNDQYIGTVQLDRLNLNSEQASPTLQQVWTEFPWLSAIHSSPKRHRSREEAITRLILAHASGKPDINHGNKEFWDRYDSIKNAPPAQETASKIVAHILEE